MSYTFTVIEQDEDQEIDHGPVSGWGIQPCMGDGMLIEIDHKPTEVNVMFVRHNLIDGRIEVVVAKDD
jgi:hypothetical protein